MTSITPCLWFKGDMDQALDLYTRVIPNTKVESTQTGPDGDYTLADWTMAGMQFRGINQKPGFEFTPAFSLAVNCADQAEADGIWDALTADGGEEGNCGWLTDRFGLSWQIIPGGMMELLADPDPKRSKAAVECMLSQHRLVVADIAAAADAAN